MKVTRRAKRRTYTPRRDARALWQLALSRLAEDLKDSVLARIDAHLSLTKGIADLLQEELRYVLYESVVRPEVTHLLAGETRGQLRYAGTVKGRIEWQGPPQNIPKPVMGIDPGAPGGDRTAVMVMPAPDKPD